MGKAIWGIVIGSLVAVVCMIGVVVIKGRDRGWDADGWAWIDVVGLRIGRFHVGGEGKAHLRI